MAWSLGMRVISYVEQSHAVTTTWAVRRRSRRLVEVDVALVHIFEPLLPSRSAISRLPVASPASIRRPKLLRISARCVACLAVLGLLRVATWGGSLLQKRWVFRRLPLRSQRVSSTRPGGLHRSTSPWSNTREVSLPCPATHRPGLLRRYPSYSPGTC